MPVRAISTMTWNSPMPIGIRSAHSLAMSRTKIAAARKMRWKKTASPSCASMERDVAQPPGSIRKLAARMMSRPARATKPSLDLNGGAVHKSSKSTSRARPVTAISSVRGETFIWWNAFSGRALFQWPPRRPCARPARHWPGCCWSATGGNNRKESGPPKAGRKEVSAKR